jgi:hypothetical protein
MNRVRGVRCPPFRVSERAEDTLKGGHQTGGFMRMGYLQIRDTHGDHDLPVERPSPCPLPAQQGEGDRRPGERWLMRRALFRSDRRSGQEPASSASTRSGEGRSHPDRIEAGLQAAPFIEHGPANTRTSQDNPPRGHWQKCPTLRRRVGHSSTLAPGRSGVVECAAATAICEACPARDRATAPRASRPSSAPQSGRGLAHSTTWRTEHDPPVNRAPSSQPHSPTAGIGSPDGDPKQGEEEAELRPQNPCQPVFIRGFLLHGHGFRVSGGAENTLKGGHRTLTSGSCTQLASKFEVFPFHER